MILVTGGTGLLGSHLLLKLTEKNSRIKALFRNEKKREIVRRLFLYYDPENGQNRYETIEWILCDVLDVDTLHETMVDCKYVYHCAAIVSFQKRDFFTMMKTNRQGTANIVNSCLENGILKLCYVSSTAAIGGEGEASISEESKWKQSPQTSGYSITKYSAEKEVWRGAEEGLDVVIVNPCVIIGAGDWNESSLTIFKTIAAGLKFYTNGSNAFVDVRDVSQIMIQLMDSAIKNERFLCIGENNSFKNLFDLIALKLNTKAPSVLIKPWLMGITWRFIWLFSTLAGKKSAITRETARSAFGTTIYDASKIKKQLNFQFRSLNEMVENAIKGKM